MRHARRAHAEAVRHLCQPSSFYSTELSVTAPSSLGPFKEHYQAVSKSMIFTIYLVLNISHCCQCLRASHPTRLPRSAGASTGFPKSGPLHTVQRSTEMHILAATRKVIKTRQAKHLQPRSLKSLDIAVFLFFTVLRLSSSLSTVQIQKQVQRGRTPGGYFDECQLLISLTSEGRRPNSHSEFKQASLSFIIRPRYKFKMDAATIADTFR